MYAAKEKLEFRHSTHFTRYVFKSVILRSIFYILKIHSAFFNRPFHTRKRFSSRPFLPRDPTTWNRDTDPETGSLIIPEKSIAGGCTFFLSFSWTQPRPRSFFVRFSFAAGVFIISRVPPTPQPAKAAALRGARRVGSSIFRSTSRKNILKDPLGGSPAGAGAVGRGFFLSSRALP